MLRLGMLPERYAGLVIYERLRRSPITNKPKAATSIDNQNDGLVASPVFGVEVRELTPREHRSTSGPSVAVATRVVTGMNSVVIRPRDDQTKLV